MSTSMNPLKFRYRILYYIILFGIFFQFFAYPIYAMVEYFPYGAKSKYYIHYERPDDYLNSETLESTEPKEVSTANAVQKANQSTKSYRLQAPSGGTYTEDTSIEIFSQDKSGTIGYDNNSKSDDPSDNIFSFNIEKEILTGKEIRLSYEVYGIENVSGISRSINHNNATGGYLVKKNSKWNRLEETISPDQLKNGVNHLMFTAFENENTEYKIKNVTIKAIPVTKHNLVALADGTELYTKNNKAYLRGNVLAAGFDLYVNNEKVQVKNNEFETVVSHHAGTTVLDVQLKKQGIVIYSETVQLTEAADATINTLKEAESYNLIQELEDKSYGFTLDEVGFNIKPQSYDKVKNITVQKLRPIDQPPLGTNIINVTQSKAGYRFLPEGAKFKDQAQISVKFDKTLLPKGYNENDVKILYFDMDQRRWLAVPTDTIIQEENKVVGLTDHFTDYIAGVIQAPESPETNSFTPTSISDIQVANPTANIVQIQPPTANQKGDGTLDFPITVPAGRNGMQPNLSVSYNNNGSSGIVGYGWDIAYPHISVDTKFGVPNYDPQKETESYLLNGEELLLVNGTNLHLPHRTGSTVNRISNATFVPKVEGSFTKIKRLGSSPSTYTWEVWDKSGTKYYYDMALRPSSGANIGKWYLTKVVDKNDNYIQYYPYQKSSFTGNLNGGIEMLLGRIEYTLHPDFKPDQNNLNRTYTVTFNYDDNIRNDANFNYRYGFKEVNASKLNYIKVACDRYIDLPNLWHLCNYHVEYHFNYSNGAFGKTLLNSITTKNMQKEDDGNEEGITTASEEYTHTFDYYNDIQGGLFEAPKTISVEDDIADEKHSVLTSTKESIKTTEFNLGAGLSPIGNPPAWWPFSYGGTINFNFPSGVSTSSSPTMLLLDIDGDGLDDKVVKIGNQIKYRKNLGGIAFSSQLYNAYNITDLGLSENESKTDPEMSVSIIAGSFTASKSQSNGRARTFFADVNSDGLVDFVKDRIVYFNRIDPNSDRPNFTDNSALTPNRIFKEGDVDPTVSAPLPNLTVGNDLMDVVKVWVAPRDGEIDISGTIYKNFVASHNGIRYSVEHSGRAGGLPYWDPARPISLKDLKISWVPWNPGNPISVNPIAIGAYSKSYLIQPTLLVTASQSTNKTNISVKENDRIYFRVNSSQIPTELVDVNWDPVVKYTNDPQSQSSQYSDAFLHGDVMAEPMTIAKPGQYTVTWNAVNSNPSTDVTIKVRAYKIDQNATHPEKKVGLSAPNTIQIFSQTFPANSGSIPARSFSIDGSGINSNNPDTYIYVEVEVGAKFRLDWKAFDMQFIPKLNKTGASPESRYIVPHYDMRENGLTSYPPLTFPSPTPIKIKHNFVLSQCQGTPACEQKYVYMIARYESGEPLITYNGKQAKFRYLINADGMVEEVRQFEGESFDNSPQIGDPFSEMDVEPGRELYVEYTTDEYGLASIVSHYQNNNDDLISLSSLGFAAGGAAQAGAASQLGASPMGVTLPSGLVRANISTKTAVELGMGTMYKNWGQFAYKGAAPDENFTPINELYASRSAIMGLSSLYYDPNDPDSVDPDEKTEMEALMNQDLEDLDYDYDEGTITVAGSPVSLNAEQMEAIRHFTMLRPDRANNAWSAHERLYVKEEEMSPYLRYYNEAYTPMLPIPAPTGIGQYGAVSIIKENTSESISKGRNVSFYGLSFGTTDSYSTSRQLNDFMDVNGDGYPDILGDKIQLTTYRGGLSATVLNKNLLGNTISNGSGDAAGGSTAHIMALADPSGRFSRIRVGGSATFDAGISGGMNKFETFTTPESVLVDINGDGLVDLIKNNALEFNTASAFVASTWNGYSEPGVTKTTSRGHSAGFGANVTEFMDPIVIGQNFDGASSSNLDLAIGYSGSRSVTHSEKDFVDFNGDGLPDYISGDDNGNGTIHFNAGTYHLGGGYSLPRLSESSSSAHGFNINASILIPISIPVLGIVVKVGGGGGKSWGTNYNEDNISLRDFDGDGYVDVVESASETQVKVQLSKIRRTNMLKKVNNPTGSTIEMDYATNNAISGEGFGPTYKMPFKKWVLSKVKVNDGFTGDGNDVQQYAFEYQNGLKDRRERKFLGFGEVRSHLLKADGKTPYRTVEQKYMLNEMPSYEIYLYGDHSDSRKYQYIGNLPVEENTYDGTQRLLSKIQYEYSIYDIAVTGLEYYQNDYAVPVITYTDTNRIVPLLKRQTNKVYHYNGTASSPYQEDVTSQYFREYNKYGDLTRYVDEVDNNSVEINYHNINTFAKYIVNVPALHMVNNGQRLSTTERDGNGNITAINRHKDGTTTGETATTNMEYNSLGQLTKVILPKPEMSSGANERIFYEYTYDDTFKLFVTEVTDAYGYTSTTNYDHFGMPLVQRDLNGIEFSYTYDPIRRPLQVKGPYNEEWTIRNEYKIGTNGLYYAITKHNIMDEIVTPGEQILHTSSFADGLGRIIQTKKQLAIEDNPNCTTPGSGYRFATSGLQVYDEFGRVTESYLGQEELDCSGTFLTALETYTPLTHNTQEKTSMVYDMQDRIIQSHVHGLNATTKYAYGYENDGWNVPRAFERVTLPEGNISVTYKDQKGRITSTKQIGDNKELVTKYNYDILSQLTKVTDADNKETTYTYDNFGQKTSVVHPDNGLSEFEYLLTGQLKSSSNQKLILQGKEITYAYNFNQLTGITYPSYIENGQSYPQHTVNYTYGANAAPDYAAGRITQITDLTGTKTMKYGKLGEVVEDTRRLISPSSGVMQFTTAYRYDSWGRMMEMTYPDGEHLLYGYNSVGQLKSIFADNDFNQWYLKDVKYNFFDQPTEITYGNDVVTTNEYDITQRIRAMQLDRPDTTTFMRNIYTYDKNQNITNITNSLSQHNILQLGGTFSKDYIYDGFNRLKNASGNWDGFNETHNYTLNMTYNNTHGIAEKIQTHNTVNSFFSGATDNAYQATYSYNNTTHPHAVSRISYSGIAGVQNAVSNFTYDANGNMATYNTTQQNSFAIRKMIWDQQNRLMAVVDDDTEVSHYVYDHAGERTFKAVGTVSTVNIGGAQIYSVLDFDQYTLYPSGYMVVDPGKNEYSKHYYINSKRFVSRLENGTSQFIGTAAKGAYSTAANENTAMQSDGLDLGSMVGAQNTTYGISTPGNTEADCLAQLNDILDQYDAIDNPPTESVQHCIDAITEIINTSATSCEALVEVNKYVCTPVDINDPGNEPVDPNDPTLTPGEQEQADCLTDLNILVAQLAVQIQNGEGSAFFEWYQCINLCVERNNIIDSDGCWERLLYGDGEWPSDCDIVFEQCGCDEQPVIGEVDRCPVLAMIYIDTHLLPDLSNACAVLNYVKENYKCVPLPLEPEEEPVTPVDEDDDWVDGGGNENEPEEDYNEYLRKPIWWYHTDHLGSSTYLTDNFGRPSHYYETLPFGEMMVEHNQSNYYKSPYPTGNIGKYDNKWKFNGKELDDATQMYYYGARYYDPRISIFVSVDPLAEQTMEPYLYTGNNPIMFTDPTGMSKESGDGGEGVDNRYRIYKRECGAVERIEYVNDDGGDNIDFITEINVDKPMMDRSSTKEYFSAVNINVSTVKTNLSSQHNMVVGGSHGPGYRNYTIAKGQSQAIEPMGFDSPFFVVGGAAKVLTDNRKLTVYRAFGGDAKAHGFSWTPVNPTTLKDFRNVAGLPSGGASEAVNTADFMIQGQVRAKNILQSRSALPLDGNVGGLPELIINPNNVKITDFKVLNP